MAKVFKRKLKPKKDFTKNKLKNRTKQSSCDFHIPYFFITP